MMESYTITGPAARGGEPAPSGGQGLMTARVLSSGEGTATIELDGRTVEVKTDVPLTPGAEYKVLVKGFSGDKVQLQIVGETAPRGDASTGARVLTDGEIPSRLAGFELPDHPAQVRIARALINMGAPVSRDTMLALQQALPANATDKQIEFMMSLVRQGVTPTREALALMPALESELAALPKSMESVFELVAKSPDVFDKLFQLAGEIKDNFSGAAARNTLDGMLIRADADATAAAAGKLNAAGRQFLSTPEARLMFLDAFQPALAADADAIEPFAQRLISFLQSLPPGADAAAIGQALTLLLDDLRAMPQPAPQPPPPKPEPGTKTEEQPPPRQDQPAAKDSVEQIRQDLVKTVEEYLQLRAGSDKYFLARQPVELALARLMNMLQTADPETATALLPEKFQKMQEYFDNLLNTVRDFAATRPDIAPTMAPSAETSAFIARLSTDLAPLLTMKFNGELFQNTAQFIETAARAVEDHAAGRDVSQRVSTLARQADAQALRGELDLMFRNLQHGDDLRGLLTQLARGAATADASAAASSMARATMFAAIANLLGHNGAAPAQEFVTYFPIQVDDRVQIGKLRVFRDTEGEGRKGQRKLKEIDPENATLVIILNTDYLGTSMVRVNTHQRRLHCAIEVENKRLKKILDKYLPELAEALKNTPFELETVGVTVRKRVKPKKEEPPAAGATPVITTIDLKI